MLFSSSAAMGRRILFLGLLAAACSNDETSDGDADDGVVEVDVPPTLRFSGLTTTQGERVESSASSVAIGCDSRFTVHLDPALIRGEGDSTVWSLQPPERCDGEEQACGYVRVILEGEDGVVATRDAATLDVVVQPGASPASGVRLTAALIQGNTQEPFLVNGRAVQAAWELEVSFESDCGGVGGAGGASGSETEDEGS